MDAFHEARDMLPQSLRAALDGCPAAVTEEIRLRCGKRPSAVIGGRERELPGERVGQREITQTLERATGASVHAAIESIRNGFISCRGLRIGICGEAIVSEGRITGFRNYSSLNIRIPHECRGAGGALTRTLYGEGLKNVLILSPPGAGKTTLLRELIRRLGDGGTRVGVIDERNELAASLNGAAQYELGRCSDIISGAPKRESALILLRGMNPEVIAMDEISRAEDTETLGEICGCGVRLLATAHARDRTDLRKRPVYRALIEKEIFEKLVTIRIEGGERKYEAEDL